MANIRKSFNFRNGVQVDDDNFIVNPNGLVGIGTSIPREFLDVHGTAKITGLVTARNLAVTGVSTFYSDVKIGSGVTVYASTGIVSATAFYGDGSKMTGVQQVAVDGWIINVGNISTTSKVGIGTTLPYHSLQVGKDPLTGNGLSIDAITGNVNTTGIITASRFSGPGDGVTNLNASAITSGTLNNARLPQNINISGVLTAYSFSGFGTNIQGINATNITNGTLSNSRLPQSISITGILTASSAVITSLISTNLNNTGIATLGITSISNLNVGGGVTINSNLVVGGGVTITSAGIFAPTGIITASTFIGGLVGIASTARDLTSNARVNITNIQSQTSSIGISTVSTRLYAESIGVGTNSPSSDIHIRRPGQSRLQVTSDTAEAIIAVGRSTTLIGSNGALIFGNTAGIYPYSNKKTLDIVNYDTGSLNYYLNYSGSGGINGDFNWIYTPDASNPLMTLTYGGNLGIGITDPTNKLEVSGNISASSLSLSGSINATGAGTSTSVDVLYVYGGKSQILNSDGTQIFPPEDVGSNLNLSSGISTFYDIKVTNNGFFNQRIGIANTNPEADLHIGESSDSILIGSSGIGIGTDNLSDAGAFLYSPNNSAIFSAIGIGTTDLSDAIDSNILFYVNGNSEFYGDVSVSGNITANNVNSLTLATAQNVTGLGTSVNFAGIPSWVKRVTVMFLDVSLNESSDILIQLGDSGGVEGAGYISSSNFLAGGINSGYTTSTFGIILIMSSNVNSVSGTVVFNKINGNSWVADGTWNYSNIVQATGWTAGSKTLSSTLDRLRITSSNTTDTFDQGTINIMYE